MAGPSTSDGSIYQAAVAHSTDPATMLQGFWLNAANEIRKMNLEDFKTSELPLARIKKIMKLDDDVKMISAEAPVLFAKAAEIFVAELTLRAWIHTEDNKRRTLQRNDIAMAITKYDQFDFLIDIVPREELKPQKPAETAGPTTKTSMYPEQVQYYFQLAQQQQQQPAIQQASAAITNTVASNAAQMQVQGGQVVQQPPFQTVQVQSQSQAQAQQITLNTGADGQQQQVIQLQPPAQQPVPQLATPQVFQQVVTATGEIQNVPIQLTAEQLQAIQAQMQNKQANQPMVVQSGTGQQPVQFIQQQPFLQMPQQQQQFIIQQPAQQATEQAGEQQEDEENTGLTIMAESTKT